MSDPLYRIYLYTSIPKFPFRKFLDKVFGDCDLKYYDYLNTSNKYNGEDFIVIDLNIDDDLPLTIDYNQFNQSVIIIKNNTLDETDKIDQNVVKYLIDFGFRSMYLKSGKVGKAINKLERILSGHILLEECKNIKKKDAPFDGKN